MSASQHSTGMAAEPPPFDLAGELPSGTTLLVASAGTGKTYAIAALASRYVATATIPLTDMLLITFTRAATRELRERIRQRLVWTRDALTDPEAARTHADAVIRLLASVSDEDVAGRRQNLVAALATFDSATIATTHEFCSQMLASLGVGADADPAETFVEDLTDLCTEVANDVYVRQFAAADASFPPDVTYKDAMAIAGKVVGDPIASLRAGPVNAGTQAHARQQFAESVRDELERRRRERSLVSYDQLVSRLATALRAPGAAVANRQRLRERYRLVMVDEFQDTDALQWQILQDAFHGERDLVLIGDPKQAIYGFRGGDVFTYLEAADVVHQRATLSDNWRSDAALVADVSRLFGDVALGPEQIRLGPVRARHSGRLTGAPVSAGLRIRVVEHNPPGGVPALRAHIARDVAVDVSELLASGATLTGQSRRPLSAGDVAVLTATWDQAELVRKALADVGIASVFTGADSVFASSAARDWLSVLRAMERPQSQSELRAAMITPLLGYSGRDLAHGGEHAADRAAAMVRGWARDLTDGDVATMVASLVEDTDLYRRLLGQPDGERTVTDLLHVAELLHQQARGGAGVSALIAWLNAQISTSGDKRDEARRRMDTDGPAVRLLTIHGAKGLEFPVVYVPYGWNQRRQSTDKAVLFHRDGHRLLDVRGPSAGRSWRDSVETSKTEDAGEDLRELYVALTRASSQVVAWWATSSHNTRHAPLHRLLAARIAGATVCERNYDLNRVDADRIAALGLHVERVVERTPVTSARAPGPAPGFLAAAPFDRKVDTTWRRTSYTGLTRAVHEAVYEQERLTGERDDEPVESADGAELGTPVDDLAAAPGGVAAEVPTPAQTPDIAAAQSRTHEPGDAEALPEPEARKTPEVAGPADAEAQSEVRAATAAGPLSPMAELPKGATFGTLVHSALEIMRTGDHPGTELAGELRRCCSEALTHRPLSGVSAERLATALEAVVTTPLGPLAGAVTLWQVPTSHRLSELEFELPLAAGPAAGTVLMSDVAALLREHLAPEDPFASYPDLLQAHGLVSTRLLGYLAGSIDAVLRVGPQDRPRFVVVDYKTNWLGQAGPGELTAGAYSPAAMAREMLHVHYPLQALLYCVALHRYLRWRLPGYDPATHLGGVQYLFLRGMCGPGTPTAPDGTPFGVFSWQPGAALVTALSDRLNGGR